MNLSENSPFFRLWVHDPGWWASCWSSQSFRDSRVQLQPKSPWLREAGWHGDLSRGAAADWGSPENAVASAKLIRSTATDLEIKCGRRKGGGERRGGKEDYVPIGEPQHFPSGVIPGMCRRQNHSERGGGDGGRKSIVFHMYRLPSMNLRGNVVGGERRRKGQPLRVSGEPSTVAGRGPRGHEGRSRDRKLPAVFPRGMQRGRHSSLSRVRSKDPKMLVLMFGVRGSSRWIRLLPPIAENDTHKNGYRKE